MSESNFDLTANGALDFNTGATKFEQFKLFFDTTIYVQILHECALSVESGMWTIADNAGFVVINSMYIKID